MSCAVCPLNHHMLLTKRPACVELKCQRAKRTGDGRSPDLRVFAFPNLPGPFGPVDHVGVAYRLQLRGQSRIWSLLAKPHRVPFSSRLPLAVENHRGDRIAKDEDSQ